MTHHLISLVIAIPILVQCHPRGEVHDGSPPETWGPAVRIAQPQMVAQDSDFTELAIDEAGNAIAVWAHGLNICIYICGSASVRQRSNEQSEGVLSGYGNFLAVFPVDVDLLVL